MYIFDELTRHGSEGKDKIMGQNELSINRSPLSSAFLMLRSTPPDGIGSPNFITGGNWFDEIGLPVPPSTNAHSVVTSRSEHKVEMANDVDPRSVLLCDLGSKGLLVEDLENALRLWSRPAVLIASRNSMDRLPLNIPDAILFLDLSWNRYTARYIEEVLERVQVAGSQLLKFV